MVELRRRGKTVILEGAVRLSIHELPFPLPWLNPKFQHDIADTLRSARREHGVRFRRPYFALDERSAIVKRRALLPGRVQDNRENLEWEAQQFLAADIGAYAIDDLLTSEFGFVVAARRAAMDRVSGICRHAGIPKPEFDLAPFALYNVLEVSAGLLSSGCELLLDVGASSARLILLVEGQLRRVGTIRARRLTTGSDTGFAANGDDGEETTVAAKPSPGDFDEWMDSLACSTEKLLRDELGEWRVDRCWLSGKHAAPAQDSLSRQFGLTAQLLDPFRGIDSGVHELDDPTTFATAAGLALRGIAAS